MIYHIVNLVFHCQKLNSVSELFPVILSILREFSLSERVNYYPIFFSYCSNTFEESMYDSKLIYVHLIVIFYEDILGWLKKFWISTEIFSL